jgi:hypothetical protein
MGIWTPDKSGIWKVDLAWNRASDLSSFRMPRNKIAAKWLKDSKSRTENVRFSNVYGIRVSGIRIPTVLNSSLQLWTLANVILEGNNQTFPSSSLVKGIKSSCLLAKEIYKLLHLTCINLKSNTIYDLW